MLMLRQLILTHSDATAHVISTNAPRHATMPICPAVLEGGTAECIWQGILDKHPVPFWSRLAIIQ